MNRRSGIAGALLRAWPLWLVAGVCVGLALGGEPVRLALRYQRSAIAAGQWWRLFTGNFVHLGWVHVGLDLSGVGLLWLLTEEVLAGWRWLGATIVGAWAIGLGLWWCWPRIDWYVGISGIAHTYWAAGALLLLGRRRRDGLLLLVFLAAKLAWEQASGRGLPSSDLLLHEPVLTAAHLVGAIAGVLFAAVLAAAPRLRRAARRRP